MTNYEKLTHIYTDLVEEMELAVQSIDEQKSFDGVDEMLTTIDKISIILKRMGETIALEIGEELQSAVEQIDIKENIEEGGEAE